MDNCEWYADVISYLQKMKCPERMSGNKRRTLELHAIKCVIVSGKILWENSDGVMLKCVDYDQSQKLLTKMHNGVCGGHYMAKKTTHKILRARFWWPTVFKDAHQLVKKCDPCQMFSGKLKFFRKFDNKACECANPILAVGY